MRPLRLLALLPLALAACADSPPVAVDAPLAERVDALFEELDRPDGPGAAVLVVRAGEVVYRDGFGAANVEHEIPITPSTVFDIASLSKQFAGMAIAMLVESGRIDLDEDIRTYLPELPRFEHTITVDHLVHHTSGLRDWPGTLGVAGWRMDDVISFDQILRMARNQRDLNFVPGAEYSYSNTGYNVLAALVEEVTGESFRAWTRDNIFRPLGMDDTHFHDDHREVVPRRAFGYVRSGDGFAYVPNGLTALGSSSLFTTVDDLARWVINFDDARVGGREVLERMQQRGVLNDGERIAYAFGQSEGTYRGLETWSHTGSWAGFRTVLLRFPEQRFDVVILSNLGQYDPSATAQAIADIYLADELEPPGPEPEAADEASVSTALLDEYVGTYRLGPGWLVTITREGEALLAQATAEPRFPMTARSQQEFFVDAYGASMTFGRDASGVVDHLTYRGIHAPRLQVDPGGPPDLADFVGVYYSAELDARYRVTVRDGTLVATHRRHGDIELTHVVGDEFRGSASFAAALEFDRNERGEVTGFRISQARSRNLRFERLPSA